LTEITTVYKTTLEYNTKLTVTKRSVFRTRP